MEAEKPKEYDATKYGAHRAGPGNREVRPIVQPKEQAPFRDFLSSFEYGSFYRDSIARRAWEKAVEFSLNQPLLEVELNNVQPEPLQSIKSSILGARSCKKASRRQAPKLKRKLSYDAWVRAKKSQRASAPEPDAPTCKSGVPFTTWKKDYDRKLRRAKKRERAEKRKKVKERKARQKQVEAHMAAFEERQALELQKKAAERIRLMEEREKQAEAERLASEERMKKNLMKYEEWKRNKAKQSKLEKRQEQKKAKEIANVRKKDRAGKWSKKAVVCAYSTLSPTRKG